MEQLTHALCSVSQFTCMRGSAASPLARCGPFPKLTCITLVHCVALQRGKVRATQTKVEMTAGDMSFSECLGHLVWHGEVVPLHHAAVEW